MGHLIDIKGLSRHYGEPPNPVVALDRVDFQLDQDELVAVMGPSGSGKSTLLTVAGGLETATAGSVAIDGTDLGGLSGSQLAKVRRRRVGFVFQGFNLLSGLTAAENVAAPLELDGAATGAARSEALEHLQAVGLGDRADAFPDDLSGGEQQRVAIARGLIGGRQILLADEPTGALDSTNGELIMHLLRSRCGQGHAVVVVTHDEEVAAWADRVVHLRDGRVSHETGA